MLWRSVKALEAALRPFQVKKKDHEKGSVTMKKKFLLILFSILLSVGLISCNQKDNANENKKALTTDPYARTEFTMGTKVTIKIYDQGKEAVLEPVFQRIFDLAEKIDVNDDAIESEVDKINNNAGIQPVKVSDDIYKLIARGYDYSEASGGSYDISIGPLSELWRIGFPDARKPSQEEIDAVLPLIDYKQIILNEEEKTVFLQNTGMRLDLGSIAKGFIADEVAVELRKNDVTSAIIDLGGNIYVVGTNASGKKWTVGIQDPDASRGAIIGKIPESDKSIVTSGIYERVLEVDGKKYHHLLNPADGYPFNNEVAGVSIISDKSIDGDGLSTSVFSKGIKGGLEYIEQFEDTEAIFISTDNKVYITSGLKGQFELTNDHFEMAE